MRLLYPNLDPMSIKLTSVCRLATLAITDTHTRYYDLLVLVLISPWLGLGLEHLGKASAC